MSSRKDNLNNKTPPVSDTTSDSTEKAVEKIIGATDLDGSLTFLVKWKNIEEPQLISATILNDQYPQSVIAFYEAHSKWSEQKSRRKF